MNPIHATLPAFGHALQDPGTIYTNEKGEWRHETWYEKVFRCIFRLNDRRAKHLIQSFNTALGHLEKAEHQAGMNDGIYSSYCLNAKKIKALYRNHSSSEIRNNLVTLKRLKNALKDRFNFQPKSAVSEEQKEKLLEHAKTWKRKNVFKDGVKEITELNRVKLETAHKYPRLMRMLERREDLREQFFNWTIRNHCDADIFALLPYLQEQLKTSHLASRISRDFGDTLLFEKRHRLYDAKLPFEGTYLSILDENADITCLRGISTIKLKEIYKCFKNKNYDVGDMEYFSKLKHAGENEEYNRHGICGENIHKWGLKVQDSEDDEYWKKLRPTERYTPEELLKAYPKAETELRETNTDINTKPWFKLLMASRTKEDLTSTGTHAWIKIAIPDGEYYNVFDIGKLAAKFPYWWWEFIPVTFHMVNAAFECPEQNIQYSHREFTDLPRVVDEAEGRKTMADILEDWQLAQTGHSKFNLLMLSCAYWATVRWNPPKRGGFEHVQVKNPNPMDLHYLEPKSPLSDRLREVHPIIARTVLGFFGFLMGNFIGGFHTEDGETRFLSQMIDYPYNRTVLPAQLHLFNAAQEAQQVI